MNAILLIALAAPFRMLGPPEPIDMTSIAEVNTAAVVYLDAAKGTWFTLKPQTAMLFVARQQHLVPEGLRLQLTNGEIFPGRLESTNGQDILQWRHAWLGRLDVPLDMVAGISSQVIVETAALDSIALNSGDRWEGFCSTIGSTLVIETMVGDAVEPHSVLMSDVRSLRLAGHPPTPPVGCSAFADGTVVLLDQLRIDADGIPHHGPHRMAEQPGVGASVAQPMVLSFGGAAVPLAQIPLRRRDEATLAPEVIATGGAMALGPIRLRGVGAWAMTVPDGMHFLRASAVVPAHLQHLSGGSLLVLVDGIPKQLVDLSTQHQTMLDVSIEGATEVQFERTTGPHGEVGATVDLVDGVLVGPIKPRLKP